MKINKPLRVLGFGLGLGIASLGAYQFLGESSAPQIHHQPVGVRSLSEVQADTAVDNSAVLVLFDLDESVNKNQFVVPAADQLTASELNVDPQVQLDAAELQAAADQLNGPLVDSSRPTDSLRPDSLRPDSLRPAELAAPSMTTELEGPQNSNANSAADPTALADLEGSSWKKNPFLGNESTTSPSTRPPAAEELDAPRGDASSQPLKDFEVPLPPDFDAIAKSQSEEASVVEYQDSQSTQFDSEDDTESQGPKLEQLAPNAYGSGDFQPPVQQDTAAMSATARSSQTATNDFQPPATNRVATRLPLGTEVDTKNGIALTPRKNNAARTAKQETVGTVEKRETAFVSAGESQPHPRVLTESVAQRSVHHIEYGKTLARRGSTHAARQEFLAGLRVLAQAHDAASSTNEHTVALRDAILAMKEAEGFLVRDTESQIGLDVSHVVETHRLKLLLPEEAREMSPISAMQRYFAYAEEKLAKAGGQNVVAAEALYSLGKLSSISAIHEAAPSGLGVARSIVYHRAALKCDSRNHRSANELGVLLARSGQLEQAKSLFKQSLVINPTPQTWRNLAKVHDRLGEQRLAQLAISEFDRMISRANDPDVGIQWMGQQEFNASAAASFHETVAQRLDNTTQGEVPEITRTEDKPTWRERLKKTLF